MTNDPNSQIEIRRRKYQDNIKLCGLGTFAFALWSILKFVLQIVTGNSAVLATLLSVESEGIIAEIIVFGFMGGVMLIDILLRFYVWRSAVRVSNGKKAGVFCIICIILFLIVSVFSVLVEVVSLMVAVSLNSIMGIVLEGTGDIILIELLVLLVKLRKIKKQDRREE